jgi:hypothetical protein
MVLAAMYALRLVSAVLHQDVGPAVPDSALDLRLGELAVVVPLILCLLGLSAWPNLVSGHAFGGNRAAIHVTETALTVCLTRGTTTTCVPPSNPPTFFAGVVPNIDLGLPSR